jgi:hypothetical protein
MSSAVAGINGVYVIADQNGSVFHIDGTNGTKVPAQWEGPKPVLPVSVACSVNAGQETCVIIDAGGNCWCGYVRPGQAFKQI